MSAKTTTRPIVQASPGIITTFSLLEEMRRYRNTKDTRKVEEHLCSAGMSELSGASSLGSQKPKRLTAKELGIRGQPELQTFRKCGRRKSLQLFTIHEALLRVDEISREELLSFSDSTFYIIHENLLPEGRQIGVGISDGRKRILISDPDDRIEKEDFVEFLEL